MGMTSRANAPLRGGVIGCGFFAQNHLHSWAALKGTNGEGVELAAVCDRDGAKASAAAERFGIPKSYTDAAEMFAAESLDFVDIVTTMPSHRPLVELAARHHVPCIVQKPFAPTWDDCVAMVETCRASGMPLMVHENFRFQTPLLAVRRVVESGVLGQLTWGRVSFRTAYDVYANQPYLAEEEHLIILDLGIHVLDVARVCLGEVENLTCQTQSIRPGIRGEDMATMMLRHANGATSVVECTYASKQDPDPFPETLVHLEGTRGSLKLEQGYRMTVASERAGGGGGGAGAAAGGMTREVTDVSPNLLDWATPPWHGAQESVLTTQRHWIECLRRGVEPETSGVDNLRTYALVMAAYESARTGRAERPVGLRGG